MKIFLVIYLKYNEKTGNLSLQGKRDIEEFFLIIDSLIPPEDKIHVLQSSGKYTEEIAKIFNYGLGEGEKKGDPLNPEKFSETSIMCLEIKNIQSTIIVSDKPIPYLTKLIQKEPKVVKNTFPLLEGFALQLEVNSSCYASSPKTTTGNKVCLN